MKKIIFLILATFILGQVAPSPSSLCFAQDLQSGRFQIIQVQWTALHIDKKRKGTYDKTECDAVIIGTPIDLNRIINIKKPNTRVYYNLQEIGRPYLTSILEDFVKKHKLL